jgi:hypothetical protein
MNRSQVLTHFLEEIVGNAAIVYHRTGAQAFTDPKTGKVLSGKDIPENIIAQGFAEGRDGMYGPGIYATYRLNSQFRDFMSRYGEYLIKCRVNLQGYIILDYAEAKKVYKNAYTLRQQLGQYYAPRWLDKEAEWITKYETQLQYHPQDTTSNIAASLHKYYALEQVVPGIVFLGGHDDAVVVTYNSRFILPVDYAYHPAGTGTAVTWTAFDAPTYRSHLRKVGTLLRPPTVRKLGDAEFSELYQKLIGHTNLDHEEIIHTLSTITSLSIEFKNIPDKPDLSALPKPLFAVIQQKFKDPEAEFLALIRPFWNKRFKERTKSFCGHLQRFLGETSLECHPTRSHSIKITCTFPTLKSILTFINVFVTNDSRTAVPIAQFLRSETHLTFGDLIKDLLEQEFEFVLVTHGYFWSPVASDLAKFTSLVQRAPATK